MRVTTILDTAAGSLNKGDEIIMDSARRGLATVLQDDFVINIPSHLSSFPPIQTYNTGRARAVAESDLKIACGTDMFWTNMWLKRNPAFNINLYNYKPFIGTIFMGVGYSDRSFTRSMNWYTKALWSKVLSHEYVHSTRDDLTKDMLEELGLKAINTGCPTLWGFTPDFVDSIPTTKSVDVVTTVSNHINPSEDKAMISFLRQNYRNVYLWLQGKQDEHYLQEIGELDGLHLLAPDTERFRSFLVEHEVDYIGPRLHAGVFALQHRRRSIILSVDHRATDFSSSFHLPVVPRGDVARWGALSLDGFSCEITMDFERINGWLDQLRLD